MDAAASPYLTLITLNRTVSGAVPIPPLVVEIAKPLRRRRPVGPPRPIEDARPHASVPPRRADG